MTNSPTNEKILRFSIVFVWLVTAATSVWTLNGQSMQLLSAAGVKDPSLIRLLILGGAGVDAALGLAMLLKPTRWSYLAALMAMLIMTLVATILDPALWLHPLGPLTKNVPIGAALIALARSRT
jgi:DoxX-like family